MTVDEIVDAYYRKIYKLCLFYLHDEQESEEILQEIFIKVMKKHSSFKGESSVYTWVYRIAVNTLINYIKRKRLVEFISFDTSSSKPLNDKGKTVDHSEADPATALESEQEYLVKLKALEGCMEKLSHREKTAFYLFHYEGLKQKEIAAIMKSSVSAVEALIHKGMKKIKRCVKPLAPSA